MKTKAQPPLLVATDTQYIRRCVPSSFALCLLPFSLFPAAAHLDASRPTAGVRDKSWRTVSTCIQQYSSPTGTVSCLSGNDK